MTLDEAIKHYEEEAKEQRWEAEVWENSDYPNEVERYIAWAEEYEQLAEWLKELRKLKKCRECPLIKEECKLCGFKEGENE